MTDRSTERWQDRLAVFTSSFFLWLIRPYLHVLNNNHFKYLKDKNTLFKDIIMVPNSVESYEDNSKPKISLQNKKFNVCYIKSIRHDTGHDDIINLGLIIEANKSQILIHIIGEGAGYQDFLRKISYYKLEGVIKTYGKLEHAEALSNLYEMDLGITTSTIEMMPNFVLECFATGIPVVGYRTQGVEDLIHEGVNGHLINLGDIDAFFKCIESFSQDSSKLSCMAKNANSSALEFSLVNIGNRLMKFYKKIGR
jgi:glycosyltransferase involved in cell wall biosynthesis